MAQGAPTYRVTGRGTTPSPTTCARQWAAPYFPGPGTGRRTIVVNSHTHLDHVGGKAGLTDSVGTVVGTRAADAHQRRTQDLRFVIWRGAHSRHDNAARTSVSITKRREAASTVARYGIGAQPKRPQPPVEYSI